jgi:SHS2 domain-containing protein
MAAHDFELLEHTADIILRARGQSEAELFENAAYGLFSVIGEPAVAKAQGEQRIELSAASREELLVAWLSELLFLFETKEIFFCEFVCRIAELSLTATARGEKFNEKKHQFKTEIKAVTRHGLTVEEKEGQWVATILLDL